MCANSRAMATDAVVGHNSDGNFSAIARPWFEFEGRIGTVLTDQTAAARNGRQMVILAPCDAQAMVGGTCVAGKEDGMPHLLSQLDCNILRFCRYYSLSPSR